MPMKQNPKEKSRLRKALGFRNYIAVGKWLNYENITHSFKNFISTFFGAFFIPKRSTHIDSFEETAKRYQLSDEDLKQRESFLFYMSLLMFIVFLCVVGYAIYMFISQHIRAGIITSSISLVAAAFAFRYHFWHFQIKQRRLGCTIKEWFLLGLLGGK